MKHSCIAVTLACSLLLSAAPALAQQDISKVNGSVVAQAGRPYGDVDTVNGSITIESGAMVADAETVNGSIRAGDDIGADSLSTVNGSIRIGERARIARDVETVNGSIFVGAAGSVGGGVSTVNGAIGLVDVDLAGGIETVSGDITVGVGSHVRGGITVTKPTSNWFPVQVNKRKPRIIIGPDAVVEGPLKFEREVTLYVHQTARTGPVTGATATPYSGERAPAE
ncbi:hypothetical protein QFW80_10415 [Luteimonas sp. M1R5S18]|jgi:hypothetical protein|uniref:Polymer-forming cytoskeletal protein n=1 Tax=Luteimonas rhizosphaericola TaxID=3042024 RepID=A0ABT6JLI1_9GAMM|nr:hypothetical protein [Luteimonas rhizosphaericola]MDH5830926.1 hypothetical protein [Luteimonas rhizosphaericola]